MQIDAETQLLDPALRKRILAAFAASIEPVPVSLPYRLGMLAVSMVMVLLPLIYICMIGAVAYGIYQVTLGDLFGVGDAGFRARFFIQVVPMSVLGILLLFMIKPLFAPRDRSEIPIPLDPRDERMLYTFVNLLASTVGAPEPGEIRVEMDVNASAGFRGPWGVVSGGVILTLGLPLIAGLSLHQLAGVLAHELGHFAQGAGMRVSFVVRSVNIWFLRVVYERDAWDAWLEYLSHRIDIRLAIFLYLSRFFIWITRGLLWILMWIGHLISSFLLRQMEYDADRYQARVQGSAAFTATGERVELLALAMEDALITCAVAREKEGMVDDLPALVVSLADELDAEQARAAVREIKTRDTGLFDSHPAHRDRVANAKREAAPGIFTIDAPARSLLKHFVGLSRAKTFGLYTRIFDDNLRARDLVPFTKNTGTAR